MPLAIRRSEDLEQHVVDVGEHLYLNAATELAEG
jgi:hypothetical protein